MDNAETIVFPKSSFIDVFVRENSLDKQGFTGWFFYPGMEFGSRKTWWGDKRKRTRPHEGTDLCFYSGVAESIFHVDGGAKIPALYDGIVVKIIADFIGRSIFIEHRFPHNDRDRFLTVYGHVKPGEGFETGRSVKAGEVIATLASPDGSKAPLPHLHLTLALYRAPIRNDILDWTTLNDPDIVQLIDPLQALRLSEK
jgi:murein DD-endopeptidase MepM/ murein hydrolase activator NlpD